MKIKLRKGIEAPDLIWIYFYKIFTSWYPHTMYPKYPQGSISIVWQGTSIPVQDQVRVGSGDRRDVVVMIKDEIRDRLPVDYRPF